MECLIALIKQSSNSKRGSSTVEAALVLPILILIIAALISTSLNYEKEVEESSIENFAKADEWLEDSLDNLEDLSRARWLFE